MTGTQKKLRNLCVVLLILIGFSPTKSDGQITTAKKVLDYIDGAIFRTDMSFTLKMDIIEGHEIARSYLMDGFKKGADLRLEFVEPAIEKGRIMLSERDNLWMYMPHTSKIIRLPYKLAFMGSDASNRDLMRLSLAGDYSIKSASRKGGVMIINLAAKNTSVAYDQVRVYVDEKNMLPKYQEFLSVSGMLIRTMYFDNYRDFDGVPFPSKITITSVLNKNSSTILYYLKVSRKMDKPASFFTVQAIRR